MTPRPPESEPMIEKVAARDLKVGDVIRMYAWAWTLEWDKITRITYSKSGATIYFEGTFKHHRRTCRSTTLVNRQRTVGGVEA